MTDGLTLCLTDDRLAVCRLPADAPLPGWADGPGFVSITRTAAELSIVCPVDRVPDNVQSVGPWCRLVVAGPLDFALTGIIARLSDPLATAGISLFPIASFDTDHLLVRAADLDRAVTALAAAGHRVQG